MSSNTFTEAVELAYAEAWRLGEEFEKWTKGEMTTANPAHQEAATENAMHAYSGAQKVLGVLLHAQGLVGRKGFPMNPERFQPHMHQVWIRLMQWAVRNGLDTQETIDRTVADYPPYAEAMENLGKDIEATDFRMVTSVS